MILRVIVFVAGVLTAAQSLSGEDIDSEAGVPNSERQSENPLLGYRFLLESVEEGLRRDAQRFGSGFDCQVTFDITQQGGYERVRDVDCTPDLAWDIQRFFDTLKREPEVINGLPHRVEGAQVRMRYDGPGAADQSFRYDVIDPGQTVRPEPEPQPEPESAPAPVREAPPATPETSIVSADAPAGRMIDFTDADLAHAAALAERGYVGGAYPRRADKWMGQSCNSSRTETVRIGHVRRAGFNGRTETDWTQGRLDFTYRYAHPDAPVSRAFSVPVAEIGAIVETKGERHLVCRPEAGACVVDGEGAPAGQALELRCPELDEAVRTVQAMRIVAALPTPRRGDEAVRGGSLELLPPEGTDPIRVQLLSATEDEFVLLLGRPFRDRVLVKPAELTASLNQDGVLTLSCKPDKGMCFKRGRRQGMTEEMRLRGDIDLLRAMEGMVGGDAPLTELLAERPFPFERYGLN